MPPTELSVGNVAAAVLTALWLGGCGGLESDEPPTPEELCDADGDGIESLDCGGVDCDDGDPDRSGGHRETCGNGIDDNCADDGLDCGPVAGVYDLGGARLAFSHVYGYVAPIASTPDLNGDGDRELLCGNPAVSVDGDTVGAVFYVPSPWEAPPDGELFAKSWVGEDDGGDAFGLRLRTVTWPEEGGATALIGDPHRQVELGEETIADTAGTLYALELSEAGLSLGPRRLLEGVSRNAKVGVSHARLAGDELAVLSRTNRGTDFWWDWEYVPNGAVHRVPWPQDGPADIDAHPRIIDLDVRAGLGAPSLAAGPGLGEDSEDLLLVGVFDPMPSVVPEYIAGVPQSTEDGLLSEAPYWLEAPVRRQGFGASIDIGDADADGVPDLVTGAPAADTNGPDAGAVHIVFGPLLRGAALEDHERRLWLGEEGQIPDTPSPEYRADRFGAYVSFVGDVNGDGFGDLAVGAPGQDPDGLGRGGVYLYLGPIGRDRGQEDWDALLRGVTFDEMAGKGIYPLEDLDRDGFDDFAVLSETTVYVVFGGAGE